MMRCTLTLILILVALALAACLPGSAQVAHNEVKVEVEAEGIAVATATAAPTLLPTFTATPPATATPPMAQLPTRSAPTSTPAPAMTPARAGGVTPPLPTASAQPPRETPTPEGPAVVVWANANVRSGPDTAYPIIGGVRVGDRLSVTGQAQGWWQIALAGRAGWIWGGLVTPNAAAGQAPEVTDIPSPPPSPTSLPPTVAPTAALPPLGSSAPLPDLVVLGPETQYPVRARVVQGWDYEFVDLSAMYDIVVYRDVFAMLAHQIDDENIRRYYPNKRRLGANGPIRVTLVDAQPHPDAGCPGWGWAPERETYTSDPLGLQQNPCLVQHSLRPAGDGHGALLQIGWAYGAGNTVAVGAYGPTSADWSTTYFAELIVWPASLGPADRPDFSQPLYQPLGAAHKADGRWVWQDAFVQIVPAGR